MTYSLVYNEQRKIAWVLVLIPLMWSAIFITAILSFTDLPDWIILISSFALIAVSLLNVLIILRRWLMIKSEVEITESYFHLKMNKKSPFYPHSEIKISWEQVGNFYTAELNGSFAVFKLLNPKMRFSLSPDESAPEGMKSFKNFVEEVNQKISAYNALAAEKYLQVITHKSIFETTGARIAAVTFLLLLLTVTIGYKINGTDWTNLNWWRLVWLWLLSAPILLPVFLNWKKGESN